MKALLFLLVLLASLLQPIHDCHSQQQACEEQDVAPATSFPSDLFGISVGISGDTAVVGSRRSLPQPGVQVFGWDGTGWQFEAELTPSQGDPYDLFGEAVAIDDDLIVVGAAQDEGPGGSGGAIHVYRRVGSTWTEEAKLYASDGALNDYFGISVAVDGNHIVVGARHEDDTTDPAQWYFNAGAVYLFEHDGAAWQQIAKLLPPTRQADRYFGHAVSISGAVIAIGALGDAEIGRYAGAAFLFEWDGTSWVYTQKLLASDHEPNDRYGYSLAVHDDVVIVGSVYEDDGASDGGAAYIYRRAENVWSEEAKLTPDSTVADARFGSAVDVEGTFAVIGAEGFDPVGFNQAGAAFAFELTDAGWTQTRRIRARSPAEGDKFGCSAALSGGVAILGSSGVDVPVTLAGRATIVPLGVDCNDNGVRDACEADCDGNGVPDECEREVYSVDHASPPGQSHFFGWSVATSGTVAVVGAPYTPFGGPYDGKVHVYRWGGQSWSDETELVPSNPALADLFGESVAIDGDILVAGAPETEGPPPQGAAYAGSVVIFRWNGSAWVEEQVLTASDPLVDASFGTSVAISGDVILVGADDGGPQTVQSGAGAAYVFRWSGTSWVQEQKLLAPAGQNSDSFGCAVSIRGNVALIGDESAAGLMADSGSAYVFRHDGTTWQFEQEIYAGIGEGGDIFGRSVCVYGDRLIVGAAWSSPFGQDTGSAHVFEWDGLAWTETALLLPGLPQLATNFSFGESVALDADTILVGAPAVPGEVGGSGAAFLFRFDSGTWVREGPLRVSNPAGSGSLGISVALSDEIGIVGALYGERAHFFSVDCLPPVTALAATESGGTAEIQWSIPLVYAGIEVAVAGVPLANLQGDSTQFPVGTLPADCQEYAVRGYSDQQVGTPRTVAVLGVNDPAPISSLSCLSPGECILQASWTAPSSACPNASEAWVYLDGALFAVNQPNQEAIDVLVSAGATHEICVEWRNSTVNAATGLAEYAVSVQACCSAFVPSSVLPAAGLACVSDLDGSVSVAWQIGDAYDAIRILVDGLEAAALPGIASSFTLPPLTEGSHEVCVVGVECGESTPACCMVEIESDFRRGDCNTDGAFDIADPIVVLSYLFPGQAPPLITCENACDGNADGSLDIADAIGLLSVLFGGTTMPEPAAACGRSLGLSCAVYPPCDP